MCGSFNSIVHIFQPEIVGIPELKPVSFVVGQDERKDWILHEVIEGVPCQFAQLHQVLKVSDLPLIPATVQNAMVRATEIEMDILSNLAETCLSFSASASPVSTRLGSSCWSKQRWTSLRSYKNNIIVISLSSSLGHNLQ